MNERIRELVRQAGVSVRGHYDETGSTPAELEKFAELVLEDVMSICEDLGDKGMDGHHCVDAIKDKFGLWPVPLETEEDA